MKQIFRNGRYANVTASLALVVALGGTSYAAIRLPANSVGSAQIKRNGVTGSDIRLNAVTSAKVKNGSLRGRDFRAGELPAGPQGIPGPQGPSNAFHAFTEAVGTAPLGTGFFDVLTLAPVPPGSYLISATVTVDNDDAAAVLVACRLVAGTATNSQLVGLGPGGSANDGGAAAFQVATTFAAPTGATLQCTNPGNEAGDTDVIGRRITALQVATLANGQPQ